MGRLIQFPVHRIQQPQAASVAATVPKVTPAPYVYETTADVARLIRAALKVAFPGVKFSVRSSNYSMGSSINVSWTDGPNTKRVEAITSQHEDVRRDEYGEILSGGNRFVSCNRHISKELELKALAEAVKVHGIPDKMADDLLDFDDYRLYRQVLNEMET